MKLYELFILAVGLSMDAFAVAICKGLAIRKVSLKHAAWVGLWFGGFQMLMPLLGFLLANSFAQAIASFDHWIAFLLLAIATSIDALAAGISLVAGVSLPLFSGGQFNASSIWVAVALIGLTTFLFSACGVKLGNRFGARYGTKAEVTGGVILILLGLKILLEHLGVW